LTLTRTDKVTVAADTIVGAEHVESAVYVLGGDEPVYMLLARLIDPATTHDYEVGMSTGVVYTLNVDEDGYGTPTIFSVVLGPCYISDGVVDSLDDLAAEFVAANTFVSE
jgi:hypothetical protein